MVEEGDQRERARRRGLEPGHWLIEKIEDGPVKVLTVDFRGGQRALPVFSHREEAEMFLWLGRLTDGWRARKSAGRELAGILSGFCTSIGFVALDPLPKMVAERTIGLVSLTREHFIDRLTGRGGLRTARGRIERAKPESGAADRSRTRDSNREAGVVP
jgi:hypothetical protein